MTDFATWRRSIFGNAAPAGRLAPEVVKAEAIGVDPEADPKTAVSLLAETFAGARSLTAEFTPAQIASGLWFLLEASYSSYGLALSDERVSKSQRLNAIAAGKHLFTDLFAPVLGAGRVPLNDGSAAAPLAMTCHSFWNLLPLGPERAAELGCDGACLDIMRHALKMPNLMCIESALIGLDLWAATHGPRVRPIVQEFLATPSHADAEAVKQAQALLRSLSP
jgi:hypothetical protein